MKPSEIILKTLNVGVGNSTRERTFRVPKECILLWIRMQSVFTTVSATTGNGWLLAFIGSTSGWNATVESEDETILGVQDFTCSQAATVAPICVPQFDQIMIGKTFGLQAQLGIEGFAGADSVLRGSVTFALLV